MGFIDKALEKAKLGKKKTTEDQFSSARPGPPEETPPPLRAPEALTGEISYTTTRTLPVKVDWLRRQRIITGAADDPANEAYKLLRTQILQRTKAANQNVLMLTGPLPGEGKTLTAINLAISLSQEVDRTVLLVDSDLRRPSVSEYFGLGKGPGLVDYLTGGMPLTELLVHPEGFPKLVILPGGRQISEAAELIGSSMMAALVKELKHFYPDRYVLFDLPPLLSFADSLAFAPLVDGIILVMELGKTPREDINQSVAMLKGFPVLGVVINKVAEKHQTYYYYYNYRQNKNRPAGRQGLLGWLRP